MIILAGIKHQDLVPDAFKAVRSPRLCLLCIITGLRLTHFLPFYLSNCFHKFINDFAKAAVKLKDLLINL